MRRSYIIPWSDLHHTCQHSRFPVSLPYFIHLPPPPSRVCYFSRETPIVCMGPDLVIWILESIFYSRFSSCQILYEKHCLTQSTHTQIPNHCDPNLATCNDRAVDFCLQDSRHWILNLPSIVEMEARRVRWLLFLKKKNIV